MSILILNYRKGFIDIQGKKHKLTSLVQCDKCLHTRELDKTKAIKIKIHQCQRCYLEKLSDGETQREFFEIDYKEIADEKNIIWMGNSLPKSLNSSTQWKCKTCGYEWNNSYSNMQSAKNIGCYKCYGGRIKIKAEDYKVMEGKHKIVLLDNIPINSCDKVNWKCENGHIFSRSYRSLNRLRAKTQCRKCFPEIIYIFKTNWSALIKRKFNYTCQKCGLKTYLESHHIKNRKHYPDLKEECSNGICLCYDCHKYFHKIFGVKYTNLNQLLDFLSEKYPPYVYNFTKVSLDHYFC